MMEQYKKANEGVRAPERLKQKAARGGAPRRGAWGAAVAAALAVALLCTAAVWGARWGDAPDERPSSGVQPSSAKTPQAVPLSISYEPDYAAQYDGAPLSEEYLSAIRGFAARAGAALLDGDGSTACSPTALYTALSMVAELAEGEDLSALLDALGADGTDSLRQYSGQLWRYLCANPDTKAPGKVTVANSLWLNREYSFRAQTLKDLADYYYVFGRTGDMLHEIPREASKWVREQTHGLLDCRIEPEEDTMAVLLSAIYFYDEWAQAFDPNATVSSVFRTHPQRRVAIGQEELLRDDRVPCNFMTRKEEGQAYYQGGGVTACAQYFQNGGKMLFLLPDEDKTPSDVLGNGALLSSLLDWEGLEKQTGAVDWRIPRFTLSDTLDLEDGLTALGLGGFFDPLRNSLPKLSDEAQAYIGKAQQGTAIAIDERGCEAASYVEIDPYESVDLFMGIRMDLNRPFVFAILSENDVPLFLGVVNDPNG